MKWGRRGPLQIMKGTRHAHTKVKLDRWQLKCNEYYSSCSRNFRYIILVAALCISSGDSQYHAAKHRTHTHSQALSATYPYTTKHAATEQGLYNESNQ